jgi:hypothetical protein
MMMITKGSKVHNSQRIDNYGEPFGVGDIIGCFIHLSEDEKLSQVPNRIAFFKNGVPQGSGDAFSGSDTEIPPGVYFPAVSLYMNVT